MKKWFTSDWHLGENRIGIDGSPNLFYRPFRSVYRQNLGIYANFVQSGFKDGDELWHLGDVVYDWNFHSTMFELNADLFLRELRKEFPNSKFNLVIGNYDEDKLDRLGEFFDSILLDWSWTDLLDLGPVYMNHYPSKCKKELESPTNLPRRISENTFSSEKYSFAITGHIHGLWKVQRNMINVGVDAWHFRPVSEDEICFCWNAVQNFYDENVFPYQ